MLLLVCQHSNLQSRKNGTTPKKKHSQQKSSEQIQPKPKFKPKFIPKLLIGFDWCHMQSQC